jgi:hypothetical protein
MRHFNFALFLVLAGAGSASAQSVLERVLGQIDGATNLARVNGTFANIAESVGAPGTVAGPGTVIPGVTAPATIFNAPPSTRLWNVLGLGRFITVGDIGTTFTDADGLPPGASVVVNADGSLTVDPSPDPDVEIRITSQDGEDIEVFGSVRTLSLLADVAVYQYPLGSGEYIALSAEIVARESDFFGEITPLLFTSADIFVPGVPGLSSTIDGSITNIITGVTAATGEAIAGAASATEFVMPTLDFGNMATTALGAVNTGEITLGVNSAVDEASASTTRAISVAMTQIGGSADTGALVLNVASNASAINGSIGNTMLAVNGSIGNMGTTALGAVNTGAITSGVNAAVQGIVGMSGQASSGL